MDPGRQFEDISPPDRPTLDNTFRTVHGQQREGERDVPPEMVARILKHGVQTPDKNRPGNTIYHFVDPDTGDRYKAAHDPSRGTLPTVTRDAQTPEERGAADQRARDQVRATSQGAHQTRVNKAAQAEKQAQRDWGNKFPGKPWPGMGGYRASKKK